jgi:hypothetical protein
MPRRQRTRWRRPGPARQVGPTVEHERCFLTPAIREADTSDGQVPMVTSSPAGSRRVEVAQRYSAWVIVWVCSFPRSGNTFLRIVLNRALPA